MDWNIHDIAAAGDVFDQVAEDSDDLYVSVAIETLEALKATRDRLNAAIAMVETQLRQTLTEPVVSDGKVYYLKADGKWRPLHGEIRRRVISDVVIDYETGEIRDAKAAVERAIDLMVAMFVSPSTLPKKGGLDRIGAKIRDVASWESTGRKLVVDELEPTEPAE